MNYKEYFEKTRGTGVLSTASGDGRVDSALYSRPHVMDDNSFAFIMHDRLTHSNLTENPYAVYLYIEDGTTRTAGKRLFLKKLKEESDPELIDSLRRRRYREENEDDVLYLVYFTLEKELPLIGPGG